jgi:hypothetical protein
MTSTNRIGLGILGLLSLADLATPLLTDGDHPPMVVAYGAAAIGLISLVLVGFAWRGRHWALAPLITVRLASALLAVPAFFASDVPAAAVTAAGIGVGLTVVGVVAALLPSTQLAGVR